MIKAKIYFINGFINIPDGLDKNEYLFVVELNTKIQNYFDSNFTELTVMPLVGMTIDVISFMDGMTFNEHEMEEITNNPRLLIKNIELSNGFINLDLEY